MSIYGYRARIGYTSPPSATEVFPYEFYRIVPKGVTLVVNTLPLVERTEGEVGHAYEVSLKAAKVMARAGIDLMVFGGLPINLSRGLANVDDLIRETEKEIGVPVTTSVSAQIKAFKLLGAKKVGVCQPYDGTHIDRHLKYIESFGLTPTGGMGAGYKFIELGKIPTEKALELGRAVKEKWPETDTLYYSCPHWAVIDAIEPLERELGVTVMTALQAITWEAMRRCRIEDRIPGYGRLLRDF